MNITFLIGNGFDLNMGLQTLYSDFLKEYKKIDTKSKNLNSFRQNISENETEWASAEIALGKYTANFGKGEAAAFSECHVDFCEQLAKYLTHQMNRIDYNAVEKNIINSISHLNQLTKPFPTQESEQIKQIYRNRQSENIIFNFICFNYTDTLSKFLNIIKKLPNEIGSHTWGSQLFKHTVGDIYYVHGTVEKEMILGVNDDTQIAKNDIFDCEDGEIYKQLFIKQRANTSYLENRDTKVAQLIQKSHIIYIYGMSIGETDKLWWERICTWLNSSVDRHLIIHKHTMPEKSVVPVKYQLEENKTKKDFANKSSLHEQARKSIQSRIHVTSDNIFEDMIDVARKEKTEEATNKEPLELEIKASTNGAWSYAHANRKVL